EELRKRLLEPVVTPAEPSTSRYRRSSRELHADQPRSNEPEDSASHQRLLSAEAVVLWTDEHQRSIATESPRTADQPRSAEPDDSAFHQQPTAKAVAPEPAPAPELSG